VRIDIKEKRSPFLLFSVAVLCTLWPFRAQDTDSRWKWLEAVGQGPHWDRHLFLQPLIIPQPRESKGCHLVRQQLSSLGYGSGADSWITSPSNTSHILKLLWGTECSYLKVFRFCYPCDCVVYLWGMPNMFENVLYVFFCFFFYIYLLLGSVQLWLLKK